MIPRLLYNITGNATCQNALQRGVRLAQALMGIGLATSVEDSGERRILTSIKEFPGSLCVFDVGANVGQFAQCAIDELLNHGVTIHCFEPGSTAFQGLEHTFGNRPYLHLNRIALGEAPGKAVLYFDKPGGGLSSLTKRRLDHFAVSFDQSEPVSVTTIDDYCTRNSVDRIHLLKLDVEGHELNVLKGARAMFQREAIDVVTFEFGGCHIDTRTFLQDFFYFFKELGMTIGRITPSGYVHTIEKYSEIDEQFRGTNFVATRRIGIKSCVAGLRWNRW